MAQSVLFTSWRNFLLVFCTLVILFHFLINNLISEPTTNNNNNQQTHAQSLLLNLHPSVKSNRPSSTVLSPSNGNSNGNSNNNAAMDEAFERAREAEKQEQIAKAAEIERKRLAQEQKQKEEQQIADEILTTLLPVVGAGTIPYNKRSLAEKKLLLAQLKEEHPSGALSGGRVTKESATNMVELIEVMKSVLGADAAKARKDAEKNAAASTSENNENNPARKRTKSSNGPRKGSKINQLQDEANAAADASLKLTVQAPMCTKPPRDGKFPMEDESIVDLTWFCRDSPFAYRTNIQNVIPPHFLKRHDGLEMELSNPSIQPIDIADNRVRNEGEERAQDIQGYLIIFRGLNMHLKNNGDWNKINGPGPEWQTSVAALVVNEYFERLNARSPSTLRITRARHTNQNALLVLNDIEQEDGDHDPSAVTDMLMPIITCPLLTNSVASVTPIAKFNGDIEPIIVYTDPMRYDSGLHGIDGRLFAAGGKSKQLYVMLMSTKVYMQEVTPIQTRDGELTFRQSESRILKGYREHLPQPTPGTPKLWRKNYMHFLVENCDESFFVFSFTPLVILRCQLQSGLCEVHAVSHLGGQKGRHWRGSSGFAALPLLIDWTDLHPGKLYLGLSHMRVSQLQYQHLFVLLSIPEHTSCDQVNGPFEILAYSDPFTFLLPSSPGFNIDFGMSLHIELREGHPFCGYAIISLGKDDRVSYVFHIPLAAIIHGLKYVDSHHSNILSFIKSQFAFLPEWAKAQKEAIDTGIAKGPISAANRNTTKS